MSKKYYLYVHNTMTGKTEKVEVTEEVYFVYRRTEWNIKDNNNSFYKHEIQLSSLIGYYENFSEFIIQLSHTHNQAIHYFCYRAGGRRCKE